MPKAHTRSYSTLIIAFLLLISFITINSYQLTYQQFLASTPTTFGLLTVTHARGGDYQYFKSHLQRYATMDCQLMSEISIVWNNQKSPEEAGIKVSPSWKRPVYFKITPQNSMDYRYSLPLQSKAQVFFSIDDDVQITCQELMKGFSFWKSKAIGDIAPLMGYGLRGFDSTLKTEEIKYSDPLNGKFYYLTLIGIAWVPRHFFQIYDSNSIYEIQEMRKIVKQKNNCDDIALNYIVSYLYPQLVSVPMFGQYKMVSPKSSQGFMKTHYPYRNQCVKSFIEIIGYCPLRLIDHTFEGSSKRQSNHYDDPLLKQIIYQRRKNIANNLLQKSTISKFFDTFLTDQKQQNTFDTVDDTIKPVSQLPHDIAMPSPETETGHQRMVEIITKLTENQQKVTEENKNLYKKISELEEKLKINSMNLQTGSSSSSNHKSPLIEIEEGSMTKIQYILISASLVIIGVIIYFGCRNDPVPYRVVDQLEEK